MKPSSDHHEPFRMTIMDTFPIRGRGIVVLGKVESGTLRKGDTIVISGKNRSAITTKVSAIEGTPNMPIEDIIVYLTRQPEIASILLREIQADQLEPGVVTKPPVDD
ncbi:MAG TPA: EF-Tu/IF-2/RF-3 family GTPase [Aggregatilineales bacterium]|nr:EF-Tu/IF-2/RF-3 family GTPase [Aggregatilineales bacterium]